MIDNVESKVRGGVQKQLLRTLKIAAGVLNRVTAAIEPTICPMVRLPRVAIRVVRRPAVVPVQ